MRIRIANPALAREQAFVANPQGKRPKTWLSRTKGIPRLFNGVHTDEFIIGESNLLNSRDGSEIHLAAVTRTVSNFYNGGGHEADEGRTERVKAVVGLDVNGKSKFMAIGSVRAKTPSYVAVVDDAKLETTDVSLVSMHGVEKTFRVDGKVTDVRFDQANHLEPVRKHNGTVSIVMSGTTVLRVTTTVNGQPVELALATSKKD